MKTDNELIANQDLIDDFMGREHWRVHHNHEWTSYHNDWNMLMPVVEKISSIIYESYTDNNGYKDVVVHDRAYMRTFGMIDNNGKWMVRINRMPLEQEDTLIRAVYKAVVEFIKLTEGERIGGKNSVEQSGSE